MKFDLFVDQPNLALKRGIQVNAQTVEHYENERVKQELANLTLETDMVDSGTNGMNTYESASHITIHLNEGDILLFDESRGYYLPPYPKTTIAQAIEDISSLAGLQDKGGTE